LKNLIEDNKLRTKKTQDPETKKDLIQKRHLLKFEFDYWDKKVKTFTLDEIPNSWKNSQLIDTQIISKYARAYLKTFFTKVDVQKGNIVSEFRKIYGIMGDEKKDRTKNSHHAVDAAVLTLIPGSAKRDEILRQYYEVMENNLPSYHQKPYSDFDASHVLRIKDNLLINHVSKDQTFMHSKKKARKRGEIDFLKNKETKQYLRDTNGNKIPKWLKGDSIRGQLNEETYFGAIKKVERNEDGFAIKENGKYKSSDEIWIVVRKSIEKINFGSDVIVDKVLEKKIIEQLTSGVSINNVTDFQNKPIRHLRCRVKTGMGFQSKEKTIELKKHSHPSKQNHKQHALSKIADTYLFLFYEKLVNEICVRDARIISLFTFTQLDFNSVEELINSDEWNSFKKSEDLILPLCKVIKVGQKVIFYNKHKEELRNLNVDELNKRLFIVYKFNESLVDGKIYNYIFLKNHIEARPNPEVSKESDDVFDSTKYQPGLSIKKLVNMNCVFEEKDFEIKPDGQINWKY
jgi:CRISPR-associated endonuclease Csn1